MKMLKERCEWFDQEATVCVHIAASLLRVSAETLQGMVEDGIGPPVLEEGDPGSGFFVFELWQWAKRVKVGPFHEQHRY